MYIRCCNLFLPSYGTFDTETIQIGLPSPDILEARRTTVERVQAALMSSFGNRYVVRTFGSSEYGASTHMNDLDLTILVRLCYKHVRSSSP